MEATTAVRDTDELCARIVDAIADHADTDALSMTPLGYVLDPDALDALVTSGTDVRVAFTYDGHRVVVHADETVSVDGTDYPASAADGGR